MKELAEWMAFRSDFYRLLSSLLLREVSLEMLKNLSSLKQTRLAEKIQHVEGLIPEGNQDVNDLKQELDSDFARIFLGLSTSPAFPYESVYRDRTGLLMQEPFDEARKDYESSGAVKRSGLGELEDHVAMELAFMTYLCNQAGVALEDGRKEEALTHLEKQKQFLQNHLCSWIPSFSTDIERAAQTKFYKSLAGLLTSYIFSDLEGLGNRIKLLKP